MKIIKIMIIVFCCINILSPSIYALDSIVSTGDNWIGTGFKNAAIGLDVDILQEKSKELYFLLLGIATVVAVIVGAILGVKYMTSGINEKAQAKESLIPYVASCIVVFGALGIWKLMVEISKIVITK